MDKFSKEERSKIMSSIRGKRTKPEMILHNWLKGNRIRHRMWPEMFGNPDVYVRDLNMVVFVNGCFWHGCGRHFRLPKTNRGFWRRKIKRNVERQGGVIRELKRMGFVVVVLWEHDMGIVGRKGLKTKVRERERHKN